MLSDVISFGFKLSGSNVNNLNFRNLNYLNNTWSPSDLGYVLPFRCLGLWVLGPGLGLNLQSLNFHHLNIWNLNHTNLNISNQLPEEVQYRDSVDVLVLNLKAGLQYCKACVVPWRTTVRVYPYATTDTTVPRRGTDTLVRILSEFLYISGISRGA